MQKGKVASFLFFAVLSAGILAGASAADVSLGLPGVLHFVVQLAMVVASLLWVTWHGDRPAVKHKMLALTWVGLVPALLHVFACYGPINNPIVADYIWDGLSTVVSAIWVAIFYFGVGFSLLMVKGKLTTAGRVMMIVAFGLPALAGIFVPGAHLTDGIFHALIAFSMGAFLTVAYEGSGKLWVPITLYLAYYTVDTLFRCGSSEFASFGTPVYIVVFVCNIMLYAVGAFYLARHLTQKRPKGKHRPAPKA